MIHERLTREEAIERFEVREALDHASVALARAIAARAPSDVLQVAADEVRLVTRARYAALSLWGEPGEPQRVRCSGAHAETAPLVVVAIRCGGAHRGDLCFADRSDGGAFSEHERFAAEVLAERVGMALEIARVQRSLAPSTRSRGDTLRAASHELRNSLNVIAIEAELLCRSSDEARSAHRQHAETIKDAARRLDRLVAALHDAAAIGGVALSEELFGEVSERLVREE